MRVEQGTSNFLPDTGDKERAVSTHAKIATAVPAATVPLRVHATAPALLQPDSRCLTPAVPMNSPVAPTAAAASNNLPQNPRPMSTAVYPPDLNSLEAWETGTNARLAL